MHARAELPEKGVSRSQRTLLVPDSPYRQRDTFEVGASALVTTSSGVLYLGINDNNFSGNSGSWTVNIKLGGLPPSP